MLRRVVDLLKENQLLKYILEAAPTLNSDVNMCKHNAQEYYFLFAQNKRRKKDDLEKMTYK